MDPGDRRLFDIPADVHKDVVYLNTANVGPRLKAVSDAGRRAIERFATPWLLGDADWFGAPEQLRRSVAGFIGAGADDIAFVPAASYGIAVAARNIPLSTGANIVVVAEQFPSNVYAWRRRAAEEGATLRTVERSETASLTDSVLRAIDTQTAIVAIPNCHWTDGELIDVDTIAQATRAAGSALVIDASQSLGALPLDLAKVKPDFLVSVGYKWLLGGYGFGYLYVDRKWQQRGRPLEESWLTRRGSEDFAKLVDYADDYRDGARRFDFGESSHFISVAMATAAISQLERWGAAYIASELAERCRQVRAICADAGLEPLPPERSAPHIVGLRLNDGARAARLGAALKNADIHVSVRGRTIRVSPHLHTDARDLERFEAALERAER